MKKVYLENPEAVIKALKEGKEIRDENNYSFKIVDGFIVATDENEFFVGNSIYSACKPYILEEESFKIEVGKWYETRNHKKARCFLIDGADCFFTIDNYTSFVNDKYGYHMEGEAHNLDIIGYWEEEK